MDVTYVGALSKGRQTGPETGEKRKGAYCCCDSDGDDDVQMVTSTTKEREIACGRWNWNETVK